MVKVYTAPARSTFGSSTRLDLVAPVVVTEAEERSTSAVGSADATVQRKAGEADVPGALAVELRARVAEADCLAADSFPIRPVNDSTEQIKFLADKSPHDLYPAEHKELIDKWIFIGSMEGFFMGEDAKEHIFESLGTCFPWISISMFLWDEAKRSAREMKSVVLAGRDLAAGNLMMK